MALNAIPSASAHQRLRRRQRDMMAVGAIDLHEVALAEIGDPHSVEQKRFEARAEQFSKGRLALLIILGFPSFELFPEGLPPGSRTLLHQSPAHAAPSTSNGVAGP
jgi:hypothetical protein